MAIPQKVKVGTELTEFPGGSFNALVEAFFPNQLKDGRAAPRLLNVYPPHAESMVALTDYENQTAIVNGEEVPLKFPPGSAYAYGWEYDSFHGLPLAERTYPGVWYGPDRLTKTDRKALQEPAFVGHYNIESYWYSQGLGVTIGPSALGQPVTIVKKGLAWAWCRFYESWHDSIAGSFFFDNTPTFLSGFGGWPIVWRPTISSYPKDCWCLVDVSGDLGNYKFPCWWGLFPYDSFVNLNKIHNPFGKGFNTDSANSEFPGTYLYNYYVGSGFRSNVSVRTPPLVRWENENAALINYTFRYAAREGLVLAGKFSDTDHPFPAVGGIVGPYNGVSDDPYFSFSPEGTGYQYLGDMLETINDTWASYGIGKFVRVPSIATQVGDCGAVRGTWEAAATLAGEATLYGLGSSAVDLSNGALIYNPLIPSLNVGDYLSVERDYRRNAADPDGEEGNEYWSTGHFDNLPLILRGLPTGIAALSNGNWLLKGVWHSVLEGLALIYAIDSVDGLDQQLLYVDNFIDIPKDGHNHIQWRDGPKGPPGADGEDGKPGPDGPDGQQGDKGPTGDRGTDGPKGPKGSIGPTGDEGPPGDDGNVGAMGPVGESGDSAPDGPDHEVTADDFQLITFVKSIESLTLRISPTIDFTIECQLAYKQTSGKIYEEVDDGAVPLVGQHTGTDCAV